VISQLRFVYCKDGREVYGEWYDLSTDVYYYPHPEMAGWQLSVQVRDLPPDMNPLPVPRSSKRYKRGVEVIRDAEAEDAGGV
jgi:hypothetical protein